MNFDPSLTIYVDTTCVQFPSIWLFGSKTFLITSVIGRRTFWLGQEQSNISPPRTYEHRGHYRGASVQFQVVRLQYSPIFSGCRRVSYGEFSFYTSFSLLLHMIVFFSQKRAYPPAQRNVLITAQLTQNLRTELSHVNKGLDLKHFGIYLSLYLNKNMFQKKLETCLIAFVCG